MVKLWVRCELFEYSLLAFPTQSRVDIESLYAVAAQLRQTDAGRNGKIKFSDWIPAAHTCLHLNEPHAIMYFELFELFQSQNLNMQRTRALLAPTSAAAAKQLQDNNVVGLYEFLLFLFVQLYSRSTPRSRKVFGTDDIWPEARLSPRSPSGAGRSGEESQFLAYVKRHIVELLQLLLSDGTGPGMMSKQQLDRLGFLITGGPNFKSETTFLSSLTPFWDAGNRLVLMTEISQWLNDNLTINTYLYPSVPTTAPASPLPSSMNVFDDIPDSDAQLPKPTVVVGQHKKTIVKSDAEVRGGTVKIGACNNCVIYAVASAKFVNISGCVNCTIVLGAVERIILVERSERIKLIGATRAIRIASCKDCTFYLCTNTPPQLAGTNLDVVFAPYNTHYPKLEQHLTRASVNPLYNKWDQPVLLWTAAAAAEDPSGQQRAFKLMPPESFTPFVVPFVMRGQTVSNPCVLPASYEAAVQRKQHAVADLRFTVASLDVDEATVRDVQTVIEGQFKEWLSTSGNIRQVYDLLRVAPEL
eukprot:TRINITY_DN7758_c0_g1_i1.p1 TRINITY_DN7758_c0_g1~~TRINITY_DN7758_c0_g1_i1.p1  ORF type:complete len:528 (+),score=126.53 TRINITY_DN7758_c0_g1_i1:68-1651(+)